MIKKGILFFLLWLSVPLCCTAQFKLIATDLNKNIYEEIKIGSKFYYGLSIDNKKYQGTLEQILPENIVIDGNTYKTTDLMWIDYSGVSLKKNKSFTTRALIYLGVLTAGASAFEYFTANDKKTAAVLATSSALMLLSASAIAIWVHQPQYDFTSRHLLEIIPISTETN